MMGGNDGMKISFADERYTKVFIVCGEDAQLRRCLICEQVYSRQASCEHSKTVCYPPRSSAN
jgi:hypothetical protein